MTLEQKTMDALKNAMKTKDEAALRGLRAIKAEIIKAKTEPGANGNIDEATELKLLQKLLKQRKDSLEIYTAQSRIDLATKEAEEIKIIEQFLPAPLTTAELATALQEIITELDAKSPADMGKVMQAATKSLAGKADGKTIQQLVASLLKG